LDDIIDDMQLFSAALSKLGYAKQSKEVDLLTSNILFSITADSLGKEALRNQRKALLIKAKALVQDLQSELGDMHSSGHTLALIAFELKSEIEDLL
jgi:hypothetical protein